MHSTYTRVSNAGALATTVLLVLLALVSSTTFLLPVRLDPASATLKLHPVHVVQGVSQFDRSHHRNQRDYAFVKFDLQCDLAPLFRSWNTKQVFVSLVADYSSRTYPQNSQVLWDRIVTSKRHARINLSDARQKYEYKTPDSTFANGTAVYSVHYHVQPYVGVLTEGEIARTEPIQFPPSRRRSQ